MSAANDNGEVSRCLLTIINRNNEMRSLVEDMHAETQVALNRIAASDTETMRFVATEFAHAHRALADLQALVRRFLSAKPAGDITP